MKNCLHCNSLILTDKGIGTNGAYCRIECWFSAAAKEYQRAYDALMAAENPVKVNDDALISEIEQRYPGAFGQINWSEEEAA